MVSTPHILDHITSFRLVNIMSGAGDKKVNDTGSYDYVQGLTSDSAGEIPIFLQVDSLVSSRRGFGGVSPVSPALAPRPPSKPIHLH